MATIKQLQYWKSLKGKHFTNSGQFQKGEHHSPKTEFKKGQQLKEDNPDWRGEKVGYHAVHKWIQKSLIKPQTCRDCNQPKKLELANLSGEYKRDITDWEWLCHRYNTSKDATKRKEGIRITAKEFLMKEGRKLP